MNKFIVAVIASSLIFISCKKESCTTPETASVVGFWKGKWGSGTDYPSYGYAALLRSNGTARFYDGTDTATANKAEGTYSVSGTTLTATYTYTGSPASISVSATVDSKFTFLEGTWINNVNASLNGKWFMNKK